MVIAINFLCTGIVSFCGRFCDVNVYTRYTQETLLNRYLICFCLRITVQWYYSKLFIYFLYVNPLIIYGNPYAHHRDRKTSFFGGGGKREHSRTLWMLMWTCKIYCQQDYDDPHLHWQTRVLYITPSAAPLHFSVWILGATSGSVKIMGHGLLCPCTNATEPRVGVANATVARKIF